MVGFISLIAGHARSLRRCAGAIAGADFSSSLISPRTRGAAGTLRRSRRSLWRRLRRIDAIFDIEREINGLSAEERRATRRLRSAPLVATLEEWLRAERAKLSRHNGVAKAIDYMLTRWPAFSRFLEDGRICLTNNAAERALRVWPWEGSHGSSPARSALSAPRSCTR